jgi:hypothetical protein
MCAAAERGKHLDDFQIIPALPQWLLFAKTER